MSSEAHRSSSVPVCLLLEMFFSFSKKKKTDEKTAQNIKSRPSSLVNVIICTVWLQFWILSSWTGEILSIIRIIFSNGGM